MVLTVVFTLPIFALAQSPMEDVSVAATLESELTTSALAPVQLQSFHERAEQKMNDFADVLTLLTSEKLEPELKKEIAKAAIEYFSHEKINMRWYDLQKQKTTELPLHEFLENMQSNGNDLTVYFSEISGQPPINCPPPSCTWDIFFQIQQAPENGQTVTVDATMEIELKKQEKYFGEVSKEIWEVSLGEIKNIQLRP